MKTHSDIFGVTETFLKSDDPPPNFHSNLKRIGKSRRKGEHRGGVGIFPSSENKNVSLLNDIVIQSKNEDKERLWNLTRLKDIKPP